MCGIAGIIYRDGSEHAIGDEMTRMLQSMKHRGPDSTGYALYGNAENGNLVMPCRSRARSRYFRPFGSRVAPQPT